MSFSVTGLDETVQHRLADRRSTLLKFVSSSQGCDAHYAAVLVHGRKQRAIVQEVCYPVQQPVLRIHVFCLEHGAGEHDD